MGRRGFNIPWFCIGGSFVWFIQDWMQARYGLMFLDAVAMAVGYWVAEERLTEKTA